MKRVYSYNKKDNTITIIPSLKRKIRNGIRVYYSRDVNGDTATDYPIATADLPSNGIVDWVDEKFNINRVEIKRPVLFGLLGYKWEKVNPLVATL